MSNVVVLIAVGDPTWGEMCLNACLSIRANDPKQKTALIYTEGTIKGIEPLINKYFDYGLNVFSHLESPIEFAFYLKTRLYDYAVQMMPDVDEFIYLDSDCIMVPGQPVSQWFNKHKDLQWTIYCNDIYDFATNKRHRKDYTFWCEPEEVNKQFDGLLKQIPQTNSSFIYWKKGEVAKELFDTAKKIWDDTEIKFQDYKGVKPDELCFNISCAVTGIMPHQTHYRPIFFTFASETQNSEYVLHYYKAFGFAGIHAPLLWIANMYNSMVRYYRDHFSIAKPFVFKIESRGGIVDPNPINIRIVSKRTLFRREELDNSQGGIFNPDGIMLEDGSLMTIYRKEPNKNIVEGYKSNSALPHVHILGEHREEDFELQMPNKPDHVRYEDFRLFEPYSKSYKGFHVSHHKIVGNLKDGMICECVLSTVSDGILRSTTNVYIPIPANKIEKNWAYFFDDYVLHIIYSLNPYRIFKCAGWEMPNLKQSKELTVKQPTLNWFHKSFISNSTNPILVGEHYVMFFHSKEAGVYYHGAVLIDQKTKEITHYTRNSIKFPFLGEGFQPTILYISGSVFIPKRNIIRVFAGEADSTSICYDFDATEFMDTIKLYPVEETSVDNTGALERLKQTI